LTRNMDQQTLLIGSNPSLVSVWKGINNPLERQHLFDVHLVLKELSALVNANDMIREAFILHGDSGNGVSTLMGAVKWPGVREETWFQQAVDAAGGLVVYVPSNEDQSDYLSQSQIYYVRLLDVLSS